MRGALAAAALAALLPQASARAFGPEGHVAVAAIATARLSPAARALVADVADGVSISDEAFATWPDHHRTRATAPLHVAYVPFGATFDPARDCPGGACAVAAIAGARAVLERSHDRAERLRALRWLVHLVADLHQPVHAGDPADHGGSALRVQLAGRRGTESLHRLLDHEAVAAVTAGRPAAEVGRALAARLDPALAAAWAAELDPAEWANASSREAQAVYADLGATPRTRTVVPVAAGWPERWRPHTEAALERAGVRLAAVLDAVAVEAARRAATRGRRSARGSASSRRASRPSGRTRRR